MAPVVVCRNDSHPATQCGKNRLCPRCRQNCTETLICDDTMKWVQGNDPAKVSQSTLCKEDYQEELPVSDAGCGLGWREPCKKCCKSMEIKGPGEFVTNPIPHQPIAAELWEKDTRAAQGGVQQVSATQADRKAKNDRLRRLDAANEVQRRQERTMKGSDADVKLTAALQRKYPEVYGHTFTRTQSAAGYKRKTKSRRSTRRRPKSRRSTRRRSARRKKLSRKKSRCH